MFRKLFIALLLVFTACLVRAQTAISASDVSESFVHPIAAAKLCFAPVDATGTSTGFRVGSAQVVSTPVCGLVSNGVLQSGLTVVATPSGTYYHITAVNRTSGAILRDYGMTPVTGGSWTLDSYNPSTAVLPVAALTMGTVTTLPPGEGASCGLDGASPILLNCGIPSGQPGINWRGTWSATTAYVTGDGFNYGGNAYIVVTAYTSGASFGSTDTSNAVEIKTVNGQPITPSSVVSPTVMSNVSASKVSPNCDVTAYGAVGDCTQGGSATSCTDNTTAIQNAVNACYLTGGSVLLPPNPAVTWGQTVYYAANTILTKGVSITGTVNSTRTYASNSPIEIRGAPGKDVLAFGDPTSVGYTSPNPRFTFKDFGIDVDDTTDVSATINGGHRKPGKTLHDVTLTNGSAVITSNTAEFVQGDVGQNFTVTDGTNVLTGTIASVPVNGNPSQTGVGINTATLSANWTHATHTNSTLYVSIMSLPVTARVGNCAFAVDDYTSASVTQFLINSVFENLRVDTVSSPTLQHDSCSFFFQGNGGHLYGDMFRNIYAQTYWGFLDVPGDAPGGSLNAGFGDTNDFSNFWMNSRYPWVTYNGGWNSMEHGQFTDSAFGPQILIVNDGSEQSAGLWTMHSVEFESQGVTGPSGGWRVSGSQMSFDSVQLTQATNPGYGNLAQWDALGSECHNCVLETGQINVTGRQNDFTFTGEGDSFIYNDTGMGNACSIGISSNPVYDWQQPALPRACDAASSRGGALAFGHNGDFIRSGNETTPYHNGNDLYIHPGDLVPGDAAPPFPTPVLDATSESGEAIPLTAGWIFTGLNNSNGGGVISVGPSASRSTVNLPATWVHVCAGVRLTSGTGTTGYLVIYNSSYGVIGGTSSWSLTTNYSTVCFDANLTSYSGQNVLLAATPPTGSTLMLGWISVRPWADNWDVNGPVNGTSFVNPNGTILPSTVAGNAGNPAGYVELGLSCTTGSITPSSSAGGTATGTCTIAASATGHVGYAAATDGTVQGNVIPQVSISGTTVTVTVTTILAGSPTAKTYNVTVF